MKSTLLALVVGLSLFSAGGCVDQDSIELDNLDDAEGDTYRDPAPTGEAEGKADGAAYDVIFLGDSNTHLRYFTPGAQYIAGGRVRTVGANDKLRFSDIVAATNRISVSNEAVGGATTRDYLPGGTHFGRWTNKSATTYVISFGLNDSKYGVNAQTFRTNTANLIAEVRARRGRPILMTSIGFGAKTGNWGAGMNSTMKMYNDIYREFGRQGVPVVDVTSAGTGSDFTIRNSNPYTVDAASDAGKPASFFANVHYNLAGSRYVAQRLAAALPRR